MHKVLYCQAKLASLRYIAQADGLWVPLLAVRVCRSLHLGQRLTRNSAWTKAAGGVLEGVREVLHCSDGSETMV